MDDKFLSIDEEIAKQSLPFYQGLALLKFELMNLAEEEDISVQQVYKMYLNYREQSGRNRTTK